MQGLIHKAIDYVRMCRIIIVCVVVFYSNHVIIIGGFFCFFFKRIMIPELLKQLWLVFLMTHLEKVCLIVILSVYYNIITKQGEF